MPPCSTSRVPEAVCWSLSIALFPVGRLRARRPIGFFIWTDNAVYASTIENGTGRGCRKYVLDIICDRNCSGAAQDEAFNCRRQRQSQRGDALRMCWQR